MRAILATVNKDAKEDDERSRVPAIHTLRHTRHPCDGGAGTKVIQEWLGHANISMTFSTDSHALPEMQDGASGAIGAVFFGKVAS